MHSNDKQHEPKHIMDANDIQQALVRITYDIRSRYEDISDLVLVGLFRRGVPLAERLTQLFASQEGIKVPVGYLDNSLYRDDMHARNPATLLQATQMTTDITGQRVILIDDVIASGRTVRAALEAISDIGRPASIQLAVLVDRGHREMPIRADYVGKFIATARSEYVQVRLQEVDYSDDEVVIVSRG
jgi:pyrimidine operon attenuation protein/uracil phosphoribosyltransferase